MKLFTKSIFILLFIISQNLYSSNSKTIHLRAGKIIPTELNSSDELSTAISTRSVNGYFLVQFNQVPTEAEKLVIASNGIELLEYIPDYTFLAYSNTTSKITLSELNINSIIGFSGNLKYKPEVFAEIIPSWALKEGNNVDLMIDRQLNVDFITFENNLVNAGGLVLKRSSNNEYLEIRINKDYISNLGEIASVKFIDFIPAPPEPEDTRARSLHRGNTLDSDYPLGPKYDGSGVNVAIADDGAIGPHIDTKGRVTSFAPASRGTHGDMTTGITMGAGNLDPRYRGMATDAYLWYYDITGYPHISQAITNFNTRGVVITSTSYSEGCNAGYTTTTRESDQQTRTNPPILHVFSAGNSSGASCGYITGANIWGTITGGRKQGKSVIATGNLDYLANLTASSSRGPAEDGRIKPDICSNGTDQISTDPNNSYAPGGGTSAAAPGIAGLAAQMYDGYRQLNGGQDPESALIKSAMLNTAKDLGNPGPDFFYGWGRVNAGRAFKLIEENRYLNASSSQGVVNTHTVTLPSALEELRLMVYWADFEASTAASKALVNNIDMYVLKPNGDTLRPWVLDHTPNATNLAQNAVQGVDNLNNMEQVTIANASAGTYSIVVTGTAIPSGPQSYYLLWETVDNSITVTYPAGGEPFVPGELETIRWDAYGNSGSFSVEYSIDSGSTWANISTSTSGNLRYQNWTVPNNITGDALIRVTRGSITGQSANTFSITPVPNITFQYTCPDSVRISWSSIPGITEYEVSMLGATHMDSIGRTNTNYFNIYNLNLADDNWISVKALNSSAGIIGRRANAILLPKVIQNCPLPYDFGITQINSPGVSVISCAQDKIPVQVTINNNGDSILTNIPISMRVGTTIYNDTIVGPINPRSFQFYTFSDSLSLTGGNYVLHVTSRLPFDANDLNDSIALTFNVYGSQVYTVPYSNNFDSFSACAVTSDCGTTVCSLNGGWENLNDDTFDMRVNSGSTTSSNTGPSSDHTTGTTGNYIYSEASNGCTSVESRVLSPCFDLNGTISPELSFWYHLYGSDMGVLRMDILVDGNLTNNIITPIFGDQGNVWLEQKLDLSNYINNVVSFRFRITTGSGFRSDLAIDDFSINDLSTGIDEVNSVNYSIYPNPSKGVFNINFGTKESQSIKIIDIQGKIVYSKINARQKNTLNLSHLGKGIYFIEIEGISKREKIVIY
jgi:hypothetical protein